MRQDQFGNPIVKLRPHFVAGNLTEFVADAFASYSAPCWGSARVLDNPRCDESDNPLFPVALRGGAWSGYMLQTGAAVRSSATKSGVDAGIGFRCARNTE